MTGFASALVTGGEATALVEACVARLGTVSGHTLGFVYATSPLARELGSIKAQLEAATGIRDWVGTVGHGVCGTGQEVFGMPALAVLTCDLPAESYRIIVGNERRSKDGASAFGLGVVHGDPRPGNVIEQVEQLAAETGAFLVGGLSSADTHFPQVAGSHVMDGGVSGVLVGSGVEAVVGVTQGCSPIGPMHEMTNAQDQVLITLDNRRALDVLSEDAGLSDGDDPRQWLGDVHAALPVTGSDKGDYVVRNLIGIDPKSGVVAIGDMVESGDRVMFVRRDAASAVQDLNRMIGEAMGRLRQPAKAALYFSCVARGPNLFSEPSREMKAIRDAFGDIPAAGFFGNGEISHDRVYAYTGVLVLFC